jgi:anti-sigma factor RsiW
LLVAQEVKTGNLPFPRGAEVFQKSGRDFVSISKDGIQLVAWQDKDVICVLASRLPKDRILALAEEIAIRGA